MKTKLLEIIKQLEQVSIEAGLEISSDIIFENAIKIFLSDKISNEKDRRVEDMKQAKKPYKFDKKPDTEKPRLDQNSKLTDKQAAFLQKLNYEGNYDLTVGEARKLIEEFVNKRKKEEVGLNDY